MKSTILRVKHFEAAALCLGLAAGGVARAQPPTPEEVIGKAQNLVAAGDHREAIRILDGALASNPVLEANADLHFLRGAAWQQMASEMSGANQQECLRAAQVAYRRTLAIDSGLGPALNNLASLEAISGNESLARELYSKAIASGGERQGFYALNYAKYLESRDPIAAIEAAKQAVGTAPASAGPREYLGSLYARHRSTELLAYARTMLDEGHTALATKLALENLRTESRSSTDRSISLFLLAATMSRDVAALPVFVKSETADALRDLSGDSQLGRGITQLLALLKSAPADRVAVDWWSNQVRVEKSIRLSGRGACRGLLLALGEAHLELSPVESQSYLRTAIELGDHGPDPDAFVRLVELYADDAPKLRALMDRYQYELFSEKSDAYRRGEWPLIYRLHVALGLTYAHLKVWRSEAPYQNALFQLEAAKRAAERLNEIASRNGGSETIVLPPVAIRKLADAYAATGEPAAATTLKIDAASRYDELRRPNDALEMLESVTSRELERAHPSSISRYQRLKRTVKQQ